MGPSHQYCWGWSAWRRALAPLAMSAVLAWRFCLWDSMRAWWIRWDVWSIRLVVLVLVVVVVVVVVRSGCCSWLVHSSGLLGVCMIGRGGSRFGVSSCKAWRQCLLLGVKMLNRVGIYRSSIFGVWIWFNTYKMPKVLTKYE